MITEFGRTASGAAPSPPGLHSVAALIRDGARSAISAESLRSAGKDPNTVVVQMYIIGRTLLRMVFGFCALNCANARRVTCTASS
ncbi:hypothetical protein [Saccharopolyspora sp. CA-218241]|uniref:hypothetical protein n=1 Tax=Saccharopolyspora sp. CA-218241 TaxID=3240027 RepID=UPI003D9916A9